MKFIVLLIILLFNLQLGLSQCPGPQPPPPGGGPCEQCNYLLVWDSATCEYVEGSAYQDCVNENCSTGLPTSSNNLLPFLATTLLALYLIRKNHKKRPLEG